MATTIVGPGGGTGVQNPSIDSAFSNVYSMFGPNPKGANAPTSMTGGGTGAFGVSPQPLSGADNSLTAFWYGLSNLLGTQAPNMLNAGGNMIGTGAGVTQSGLDTAQGGLPVMQQGLNTMQPSIDFYTKLLSGDPTTTTAALAPTAANIASITQGATQQSGQGMPQGGYRAATLAGLPFAQASQVGNAALQLQPAAAQALGQLGGEQAQIGGAEGQLGLGIAQTGLGLGEEGLGMTGQGFQALDSTIKDVLQKMGINYAQGTPMQNLTALLSAL